MKKLINALINSLLLVIAITFSNVVKTVDQAPDSTDDTIQELNVNQNQGIYPDSSNEVRRQQLNSDIRARKQRNQAAFQDMKRSDNVNREVGTKLKAIYPIVN